MRNKIWILVLMLILLAGCADTSGATVGENEFYVNLSNQTEGEIYWIQVDFFLDDVLCGSVTGCNADNSAIGIGETLCFNFLSEDFPEEPDLSGFRMEVSVLDAGGESHTVENQVKFSAVYGNIYRIVLKGDSRSGYVAQRLS